MPTTFNSGCPVPPARPLKATPPITVETLTAQRRDLTSRLRIQGMRQQMLLVAVFVALALMVSDALHQQHQRITTLEAEVAALQVQLKHWSDNGWSLETSQAEGDQP